MYGLQRYAREADAEHLPVLFSVMVLVGDVPGLQELARSSRERLQGASLQGLAAMLRDWPSPESPKREATLGPWSLNLANLREAVVREAVCLAGRKCPSADELRVIAAAAAGDAKAPSRLAELAASPALLASLPAADRPWLELAGELQAVLGPLAAAGAEASRLEAACAARLLLGIEKGAVEARDYVPALLMLPTRAFGGMPALIQAVAERLEKARLPRSGSSEAGEVRKLCERLVQV